jgi:heavy metal sensor kinase
MIPRPRSVRLRLTLWYTAALAMILAIFALGVYLIVRASLLHQVSLRAQQELAVVTGMLEENPSDIAEVEEHGMASLFAVVSGDVVLYESASWGRLGLPSPHALQPTMGQWRWESQSEQHVRGVSATVDAGDRPLLVAAAAEEDSVHTSLRTLAVILTLGFPVALAGSVAGGWFLAGRMLKPVVAMANAARQITADRLSDRLPIGNRDDEFGRLAHVFNHTLARLEDAFARLRRFTSDASHELRTPLTAMRSVGEVALRDHQPPEQYREAIGSMLEEVDRLTHLVDSLLTLTRADSGAYRAASEMVELGALVQSVVDSLRILADDKGQLVSIAADEEALVEADRVALRLAVINVLDNAIKYTPPGGSIRIAVAARDDRAVVEVADSGPGIPPEHAEKIFERFYRIERDRSRASGGVGLGLAIARWAVELNGGRIELDASPGAGSTFRIILPRSRQATSQLKQQPQTGASPAHAQSKQGESS